MIQRRAIRFSIRTLLFLVAVIGVLMAVPVNRARHQKRVVDQMEALPNRTPGRVLYHYQWPSSGRLDRNAEPPGPAWLRSLLGDHYFQKIRVVEWVRPDEELLHEIGKLDGVETMRIDASLLTDEDALRHIAHSPELVSLTIRNGRQLSALNLVHLRDSKLRELYLEGLMVNDTEVEQIVAIESLEQLTIKQTFITQEKIDWLREMRPQLKIVFGPRIISPSLFP